MVYGARPKLVQEVERLKAELAAAQKRFEAMSLLANERGIEIEEFKEQLAAANERLTFLQECIRLHHGGEPHEHE